MKTYQLSLSDNGPHFEVVDQSTPGLGAHDVLIDVQAWSLNYRDLAMLGGGYPGNDKIVNDPPLVPLSDCAGIVCAVGSDVTRVAVGDRVSPIFYQDWMDGDLTAANVGATLGGGVDGVMSEFFACSEESVVKLPDYLSFEEAATLPCACVTAWEALSLGDINADQTVLMIGTGGVSIFALQLVVAKGAKAIVVSSSDEKLARATSLGASHVINYQTTPDWHLEVLGLTHGIGVDHVIEVGGAGTYEKSCIATKFSGRVSLIGVLTGYPEQNPSPYLAMAKRLTVQGIAVGSRDRFESLLQVMDGAQIHPVIDRRFDFAQLPEAMQYLGSAQHVGKVVLTK